MTAMTTMEQEARENARLDRASLASNGVAREGVVYAAQEDAMREDAARVDAAPAHTARVVAGQADPEQIARMDALRMIEGINAVPGFDPNALAVTYTDMNSGEIRRRLPTMALLAWFRLVYPMGKIAVIVTPYKDGSYTAMARVYRDVKDAEEHFLAEGSAQRSPQAGSAIAPREWAQTAAIGIALRNAGFGLAFAIGGDASDGVTASKGETQGYAPRRLDGNTDQVGAVRTGVYRASVDQSNARVSVERAGEYSASADQSNARGAAQDAREATQGSPETAHGASRITQDAAAVSQVNAMPSAADGTLSIDPVLAGPTKLRNDAVLSNGEASTVQPGDGAAHMRDGAEEETISGTTEDVLTTGAAMRVGVQPDIIDASEASRSHSMLESSRDVNLDPDDPLARAMRIPCPVSKHRGKTLGDLIIAEPGLLTWLASKYDRDPDVRAGARLICESALPPE